MKEFVKYTIRAASSLGTARQYWDDFDTLDDELKKNSRFFYVEVEAK